MYSYKNLTSDPCLHYNFIHSLKQQEEEKLSFPMSSPVVALCFSLFLLCLSVADAFNITQILSSYPDFTAFNNYLIQTGVAAQINRAQTLTVLAVANANMSDASGLSQDAAKKTLSVHVVLDYFDTDKLKNLNKTRPVTLATLYQQSGLAQNQEGFLNVTEFGNDGVAFRSASPGSSQNSVFIKSIAAEPYNISVLQISNIIEVNVSSTTTAPAPPSPPPSQPPAKSPSHQPVASPPRKVLAPAPSKSPAASPPKPKPSNDSTAPSEADAEAPALSPSNSIIPGVEVPGPSDAEGEADKKSAADVTLTSGNYLAFILVILTTARLVLTMNI